MRVQAQLVANVTARYRVSGNFFYLESLAGGLVSVQFFRDQQKLEEEIENTSDKGWIAEFRERFNLVEITSTINQVVIFHVARGRISVSVFSGSVVVNNVTENGVHVPAAVQVSNVSVQLKAANAARKYLLVQNIDPVTNLYVRGDGVAATANNASLKIPPGGVWEPKVPPTGQVNGIMDAVTAVNNVHVIEA